VKEKVYSDANARGHIQTPKYGELFGLGDYVFVPSIERKVEDVQEKIAKLQAEKIRLDKLEKAAVEARDEQAQRNAALEKRVLEAKLKAEELRQGQLAEDQRKRKQQAAQQKAMEDTLASQKLAAEQRLIALRKKVEEKRKSLGSTTLSALSPEKSLADMQRIDVRINEIREQFRTELKTGVLQIVNRFNVSFLQLTNQTKDEFETSQEFESRKKQEHSKLNGKQAGELTAFQEKVEKEYNVQISPFLKQLHDLSVNEFTLTAGELILKLGMYNSEFDTYPLSIQAKKLVKGVLVAANGNVPIPRMEAREFKQHFENNMLRPEIKGSFLSPKVFLISKAYVVDDATSKKYDLFNAPFVDLGNRTIYDPNTLLIWSKFNSHKMFHSEVATYINGLNNEEFCGFSDWRLPTKQEFHELVKYARDAGYGDKEGEKRPAAYLNKQGFAMAGGQYWYAGVKSTYGKRFVLPVRSGR